MFKLSAISACCSGAPLQHALEGQAGRGCAGGGGGRRWSMPQGLSAQRYVQDASNRGAFGGRCGNEKQEP